MHIHWDFNLHHILIKMVEFYAPIAILMLYLEWRKRKA